MLWEGSPNKIASCCLSLIFFDGVVVSFFAHLVRTHRRYALLADWECTVFRVVESFLERRCRRCILPDAKRSQMAGPVFTGTYHNAKDALRCPNIHLSPPNRKILSWETRTMPGAQIIKKILLMKKRKELKQNEKKYIYKSISLPRCFDFIRIGQQTMTVYDVSIVDHID